MRALSKELPEDDPLCCPISLFGVMQHGRLETAHTQVLAWLLDPKKEHGFGDGLLRSLLSVLVGGAGLDPSVLIRVEATHAEFPFEEGRLDVLALGEFSRPDGSAGRWLLLIEAKIDANEGEHQLKKYDKWVGRHSHGREVFRVFLTPEGRAPETAEELWTSLSFLQLACIFRAKYKDLGNRPGYHFLRHYLTGVLKDICQWDIPVREPETCEDPYNFVEYLRTVSASKEHAHDAVR